MLTASRKGEWIELDFPATPAEAVDAPVELLIALGVEPTFVGKSIFDYLVEVGTEEAGERGRAGLWSAGRGAVQGGDGHESRIRRTLRFCLTLLRARDWGE